MRFLLRLAGLAIILWLHHPLLASPATADTATPLRERDRIAVQVIFSYGDSHTKTLPNGSTIRFESERSGSFDAMLDRYRAYYSVDSFKLEKEGSGNISVGDSMTFRVGGQSVVRREEGNGRPSTAPWTSTSTRSAAPTPLSSISKPTLR